MERYLLPSGQGIGGDANHINTVQQGGYGHIRLRTVVAGNNGVAVPFPQGIMPHAGRTLLTQRRFFKGKRLWNRPLFRCRQRCGQPFQRTCQRRGIQNQYGQHQYRKEPEPTMIEHKASLHSKFQRPNRYIHYTIIWSFLQHIFHLRQRRVRKAA